MTDRIDHAAEARKILHEATHDEHGAVPEELLDDEEKRNLSLWWQEAQVHAMLAVADQARVANIISLARVESENTMTPTDALDTIYTRTEWTPDEGVKLHTRPEIAAALGIEEVQS